MRKIEKAISEVHEMDHIANKNQWVNNLHPLVKLFVTILYIFIVVSFDKYDLIGLIAMGVYLFVMFNLAEISLKQCLWRLRIILPIVAIVGIANPFLDDTVIVIDGLSMNGGIISMITLMLKGIFAVLASYILIATTSIEKICYALRLVHVPSIIVTQILLTYRYITVLLGEVQRITDAYSLRAPNQKGIHFKVWGSLTGQLLLRSIDRANDVYDSMMLRGYKGEFDYIGYGIKISSKDIIYLIVWTLIFSLFRNVPVILVVGNFIGEIFG